MAILVIYCKMHFISFKKNILFTPGKRKTNFFTNDEQGLNSKYENSTFQDSWGRGSPANVWPYWSFKLNFMTSGVRGSCARVWPIWSLKLSKKIAKFMIQNAKFLMICDTSQCTLISATHASVLYLSMWSSWYLGFVWIQLGTHVPPD